MNLRPVDRRRAAVGFRHGLIAILTMLAIAGFAALAATGAIDRQRDQLRAAQAVVANSADRAHAIVDRQQKALTQFAQIAATEPDATAKQFLDHLPALMPGVRIAAVTDPSGTVELRGAGESDETTLAALAADAAKSAAAEPRATFLVTHTVRDGSAGVELVGLAQPWPSADGRLAGIVLIAIDHSAFAGLDLARADGSPLFAVGATADLRQMPLADFPLTLRYRAPTASFWSRHGAWPFAAAAIIGVAALLGVLGLLSARLYTAQREAARQAIVERDLRAKLAVAAEAAGRVDELSRTKSRFFAQVTHELRTPLNAILGFSQTIRQEMFGPVVNPRYLEYAGLIHDAGEHLLSLINDLLDEARIESGKMEIVPIRLSAPALARSALDLVELLAEGRDIAVTTRGLSICPDLNVDPRAMKQVLLNLLSNAIKYTPHGGRIDLHFRSRDDSGVAIEIADTGIGMSAEDLQVVFEPFGRAGGVEARRQQGSGLGLSLARALVRLHGGDLTLASELGSGTTATIVLPASAVFAPTASAKAA